MFGSFIAELLLHSEACDASTQQSKESSFGSKMSPLSFVPKRYLQILFTACACETFGEMQYCEYIVPIYSVCTCRNMELIVNNENGILYGKSRFRYVSRNGTGP